MDSKYSCIEVLDNLGLITGCGSNGIPDELVNAHGKSYGEILSNWLFVRDELPKEVYTRIFESDCNKHDICYGCVSNSKMFSIFG